MWLVAVVGRCVVGCEQCSHSTTLTWQAAAFYNEGIQKLVPRYDNYLNNCGEYVEKQFEECGIR